MIAGQEPAAVVSGATTDEQSIAKKADPVHGEASGHPRLRRFPPPPPPRGWPFRCPNAPRPRPPRSSQAWPPHLLNGT